MDASRMWVVQVKVDEDARTDDNDPEYMIAFVADPVTGEGVGHAWFYISDDGQRAVISDQIYVDEGFRRQGIATAVLHRIHEYTGLPVDPNGFSEAGLSLWLSLGWNSFGH